MIRKNLKLLASSAAIVILILIILGVLSLIPKA